MSTNYNFFIDFRFKSSTSLLCVYKTESIHINRHKTMWSNLMTSLLIEVMAMIRQLVYLQHQGRGCTIYHARSWHIPIMMFIFNWTRTMQLIPMHMQIMGDIQPAQLMQSSRWRRVIEYSSNTGMYQNLKKSVEVPIQRFLDILCKNKKYFDINVVFSPYY